MTQSTTWQNPDDQQLKSILKGAKNIAVVGCSPKPDRTSHQITAFLIKQGYNVFPIHPKAESILGRKVYPNLEEIPYPIDIVNVFRKPEFTPPIAEKTISVKAKVLWLQQGIINEKTWHIANHQGVVCIMDRCIAVMHRLLLH